MYPRHSPARRVNSTWLALLALGEHVILIGNIEHLPAGNFARDVFGIATNPPRLIAEALNAQ
jgi:hypothetical protein